MCKKCVSNSKLFYWRFHSACRVSNKIKFIRVEYINFQPLISCHDSHKLFQKYVGNAIPLWNICNWKILFRFIWNVEGKMRLSFSRSIFFLILFFQSVAVEIKHDDKLSEEDLVFVQVAILYTSCFGERRVRILNLSLRTCTQLADLYRSCELDTLVNYWSKAGACAVPWF